MAGNGNKPFYKKWWVWLLAIVLVLSITSCFGDDDETPTPAGDNGAENAETNTNDNGGGDKTENGDNEDNGDNTGDEGDADEADKAQDPADKVFSVGEAVQLGDNVLTVTNVERSTGSQFDKPQEGKEYVIVTVKIDNAGDKNITYNPFDFKMANSQGQIVDQAFTIINTDTALQSGELAPNGSVSGTLAFEQPANDPALQLQYSPSFWSNDTVKVDLQ